MSENRMNDTARHVFQSEAAQRRVRRRYAAERRFRLYGLAAVTVALAMLGVLLATIVSGAVGALRHAQIELEVPLPAEELAPQGEVDPQVLAGANYLGILRDALRARFPDVEGRRAQRELFDLVGSGADLRLRELVLENPGLVGQTVRVTFTASDTVDQYLKGNIPATLPEAQRPVSDAQIAWLQDLQAAGQVEMAFNTTFFTSGDSREPENAGILGALIGSMLTLVVTLAVAFPVGVAAAIYLEEFAPKNRWTDLVEVNINNLAAVPSIVFGLLGLAVFLNFFGLPRSTPVVGGLVLSLLTLPVVIIASRAALKAVPPSIREAALGVGASPLQVVFHHVLPLAMPGVMTGTIIGMARALGETAPLLMIGMVAFIADVPQRLTDPATVLPVQIFIWADSPERAFVEKTSAAILVLLLFLIVMNAAAVILRRRFERRW